ncbi:MAG: adenylate/guanylate cyclase domain-containing protein [Mesorhizobium sp.]|nr:MAG: adenylate/guanylate cyclase domain-containing protein [Mesorhizobium sp.]
MSEQIDAHPGSPSSRPAHETFPSSSRLPSWVVTFLLSDVEGSTRLWEGDEGTMGAAIARHYELLDAAITLHGGVRPVEQGEGDSVVGVFARPSDAIAAALHAQRTFAHEPWPGGQVLRIRIALHTGEAQLRGNDYYVGRTVIRCARLRAIAHGGQTVLSGATRDLVADRLPDDADLRDLGSHRLKDLGLRSGCGSSAIPTWPTSSRRCAPSTPSPTTSRPSSRPSSAATPSSLSCERFWKRTGS